MGSSTEGQTQNPSLIEQRKTTTEDTKSTMDKLLEFINHIPEGTAKGLNEAPDTLSEGAQKAADMVGKAGKDAVDATKEKVLGEDKSSTTAYQDGGDVPPFALSTEGQEEKKSSPVIIEKNDTTKNTIENMLEAINHAPEAISKGLDEAPNTLSEGAQMTSEMVGKAGKDMMEATKKIHEQKSSNNNDVRPGLSTGGQEQKNPTSLCAEKTATTNENTIGKMLKSINHAPEAMSNGLDKAPDTLSEGAQMTADLAGKASKDVVDATKKKIQQQGGERTDSGEDEGDSTNMLQDTVVAVSEAKDNLWEKASELLTPSSDN